MGFTYRKEAGVYRLVANMFRKDGGVWVPATSLNQRVAGIYKNVYESEIVVTITTNQTSFFLLSSLFDPGDWTANKNKRVVINAGVTCSPGSGNSYAIAIQSAVTITPWGGILTIDNHGTIQGNRGVGNSGVGGDAFYSGTYAYTGGKKLQVNNYGTIRAGGGGGGKGGAGGGGQYGYTASEGPYGVDSDYCWLDRNTLNNDQIKWGNSEVWGGNFGSETTRVVGIYTYIKGSQFATDTGRTLYRVSRTYPATANTSGGAGGNGGSGQGADGSASAGSAGSAGGTNAGTGGTGGTGGGWGLSGNTGGSGASGNRTGGSAGTAGGVAGYAYKAANHQIIIPGTILGRVA